MAVVLYASSSGTREVVTLAMDERDGRLAELSRLVIPSETVQTPGCLSMVLHPSGRFLYAALRDKPYAVITFAVDPARGALTPIHRAHAADVMVFLSTDPSGRWVLGASWAGSKALVAPIDAEGRLGDTTQVLAMPPATHSALTDPQGRFVYIAAMDGDVVLCHAFDDRTGRMSETPASVMRTRPDAGPRHLAMSRDGAFLYCINEYHGTVSVYARDAASGALSEVQSVSILPEDMTGGVAVEPEAPVKRQSPAASDVQLSPDGNFLYASDRATRTLSAFTVDRRTGRLTPVMSAETEALPRGFVIEPGGRFLLCLSLSTGTILTYSIDPESGALTRTHSAQVADRVDWLQVLRLPGA